MVKTSDIADLLNVAAKDMLRDVPLRCDEWRRDNRQLSILGTTVSCIAYVDCFEVMKHSSDACGFLMLLKTRLFDPIEQAYLGMVKRWGMKPSFVIEEPKCADYYEGFVS